MDCRTNSDLFLLTEEKFDFDVTLSPASSKGDEDEDDVFSPVSHKRKCVSANVASRLEDSSNCVQVSWSPLTGDQLDAVFQEAHQLATQLQNNEPSGPQEGETTTNTTSQSTNHKEEFAQDTEAKLDMLGQAPGVLSPIKRETFCVQDSPMRQLPPAIQRRLLRGSSANVAPPKGPTATSKAPSSRRSITTSTASSTRPATRLSTSSPVIGSKVQSRTTLRGKASLGVGVVLPSKPAAPPTSCLNGKTRVDRTRLQPPSKAVAGWRRSPGSHSSSRAESYEDLLSDSASVASDVSDCSLNSSVVGKRTLAPPTKTARNLSSIKAPPLQNRRVTDRRNTSSSSSSVSSFNSSMSHSPAKGKLNSSVNRSLSSSTCPAPSSISRTATLSRTRRSISQATAAPAPSHPGRRSLSTQARKLSEAERLKAARSTPPKKAEVTPQQQLTPARRGLERSISVPPTALVHPQSGLKAKPKPEALVAPTPSGLFKGLPGGDGASKMLQPKRLVSMGSMDSLPQKSSSGPLTPSAGGHRPLPMKARRPSALPTPIRHKMSAIVTPTPNNQTHPTRPPLTSADNTAPCSIRKESSCSPTTAAVREEEPVDAPDIQPFSLEEEEEVMEQVAEVKEQVEEVKEQVEEVKEQVEELPAVAACSPPEPNKSADSSEAPRQNQTEPVKNPIKLETTEESSSSTSKPKEVLLLDLPTPALRPQEKLLIDLSNTPDLLRSNNKNCTSKQLIDLSSPLIKWSPEDKRENTAPLINLSF